MKRTIYIAGLVMALAVTMLASCKKTDFDSQVIGEWKLTTVSALGISMTVDQIKKDPILSAEIPYAEKSVAHINEDHTFDYILPTDGQTKTGTWSFDGGTLKIKSGYARLTGTYVDGQIVMSYELEDYGITVDGYYSKVSK